MEVGDLHRRVVAAMRGSWDSLRRGTPVRAGKSRQRWDALALPEGAGLSGKVRRYNENDQYLKLRNRDTGSNLVDVGRDALVPASAARRSVNSVIDPDSPSS